MSTLPSQFASPYSGGSDKIDVVRVVVEETPEVVAVVVVVVTVVVAVVVFVFTSGAFAPLSSRKDIFHARAACQSGEEEFTDHASTASA
jgi:hypothetical protein